ncbi:MAG: hypothetical protein P0S94_02165 [Simkaniaceae bacterium]|nr:hypothetical protein [Simkaniaceae bacterium]
MAKSENLSYREKLLKGLIQHRPGSRKQKLHSCFDEKGEAEMHKMAKRLGIKDATAKAWARDWRLLEQTGKTKKPAAKKKATAKKTTKAA